MRRPPTTSEDEEFTEVLLNMKLHGVQFEVVKASKLEIVGLWRILLAGVFLVTLLLHLAGVFCVTLLLHLAGVFSVNVV